MKVKKQKYKFWDIKEKEYIKENIHKFKDISTLTSRLNAIFKTERSIESVRAICNVMKIYRAKWTQEQSNFLIDLYNKTSSFEKMRTTFNRKFSTNKTKKALVHQLYILGVRRLEPFQLTNHVTISYCARFYNITLNLLKKILEKNKIEIFKQHHLKLLSLENFNALDEIMKEYQKTKKELKDNYYTVSEVSNKLKVTEAVVHGWVKRNKIEHIKFYDRVYIKKTVCNNVKDIYLNYETITDVMKRLYYSKTVLQVWVKKHKIKTVKWLNQVYLLKSDLEKVLNLRNKFTKKTWKQEHVKKLKEFVNNNPNLTRLEVIEKFYKENSKDVRLKDVRNNLSGIYIKKYNIFQKSNIFDKEKFLNLVKESKSLTELIRKITHTFKHSVSEPVLKKYLKDNKINTDHFIYLWSEKELEVLNKVYNSKLTLPEIWELYNKYIKENKLNLLNKSKGQVMDKLKRMKLSYTPILNKVWLDKHTEKLKEFKSICDKSKNINILYVEFYNYCDREVTYRQIRKYWKMVNYV